MVCIGKLNKEITIQEIVETVDAGGGTVATWTNLATDAVVWASIDNFTGLKNPTGRDIYRQRQIQNELTYKFTIRNRTDLTSDMRIVYNGKNFNIRTILENENLGEFMEIFAEKGVAQ